MADYSQQKVPDLKKLLQERGLVVSGNKADLVARLQEDDNKKAGTSAAAGGEDEIDWDEDDKATTAPATAAIAAGGQGQVANPTAVPNQVVDTDPSKTADLKVTGGNDAPEATNGAEAVPAATAEVAKPEAPKQDFTRGLQATDAEIEAAKRAARAKKFGITEDDEAKKLAERAKKFGTESDTKSEVVKGLDSALPERPERRQKRAREEKQGGGGGGRAAKRQTPDRRTEAPRAKTGPAASKKAASKLLDDPIEREKAEKRAERFAKPTA